MTKLSYTLGMKVFACFIAVLSGITAFFDGIGIFLANSYDFYSSSLAELKLAHPYLDTGMLTKLYGMRGSLLPILVISLLLFAISVIYLLCAAGHRPDTDEIVPNLQDKIPLDLYFAIICPILLAILFLILEGRNPLADTGALSFVVIGSIILAILGLATLLTCVTRLKLGRYFYQHTIAYQVIRFCWKMLAAVCSTIADAVKSISTTWKIAVAWLVISAFYTMGGFGAIVLSFALLLVFCSMASQMQELKNGGEELAKGNLNYKINTQRMFPLFRAHGKNLNSISKGFSIALEQKMKSEHLKTELITNVSHDLKTPLTSIINYVDLMKRENPTDPKIQEYLRILDEKSQRLKVLTEDVVEASKASTGNIKLEMNDIDFVEMVQQVIGEFEEKFQEKNLTMMVHFTDEPSIIYADGQRMWRVLENVFGNVVKYAMEGTRVYAEISNRNKKVTFSLKNISAQPLNISADELTERFIRGDVARNTEGSGLGLSIAKSLTELQ
uniref:sensor histidine kinase n=1 Tax=Anaerostipes sp. TaxID=1872530 RepID=UPI00258E2148